MTNSVKNIVSLPTLRKDAKILHLGEWQIRSKTLYRYLNQRWMQKFCIRLVIGKFSDNNFVSLPKPRKDAKILHLGEWQIQSKTLYPYLNQKWMQKFCILVNDKFTQSDIVSLPKLRKDAKILHHGEWQIQSKTLYLHLN